MDGWGEGGLLCIFMFFFNRMKITQPNHITIFALLLIVSFQGLLRVGWYLQYMQSVNMISFACVCLCCTCIL
jgi:hypothetical protein